MSDPTGSYTDDGHRGDAVSRDEHNAVAHAKKVVIKGNDGSSFPDVAVDSDGHLQVEIVGGGSSGAQFDDGDTIDTDSQGNLLIGTTAIPGTARAVRTDNDGHLQVDILSGGSSGIQYAEGDTTDPATGTVALFRDGAALVAVSTAAPLPVEVVGTVTVAEPVTVDGTVAVSSVGGTVTVTGAVTVSDGSGPLTVDGTVTANAGTNLNTSALSLEATQLSVLAAVDGIEGLLGTSNTNTGACATSLAVLDDWDESDRAKVNPIVGQAGVQGGAGAVSSNTQRVALATDANTIQGTVTASNTTGNIAHDLGVSGNPVQVAYEADNSIRPAVSADQDVTRPWADRNGRTVTTSMYPGECTSTVTTFTTGTAAAVTSNPASTSKLVIYAITVHNSSSTKTTVDFKDGSGGTTVWSLPAAAECGGACQVFPDGLPLTADNELFADPTTAVTTLTVSVLYKTVVV